LCVLRRGAAMFLVFFVKFASERGEHKARPRPRGPAARRKQALERVGGGGKLSCASCVAGPLRSCLINAHKFEISYINMYYYRIRMYQIVSAMGFTCILLEPHLSNPVWQPSSRGPA